LISKIINKNDNLSDKNSINIEYDFNEETREILELKEKLAFKEHIYHKQMEKNK